ncbi:ribonuclease III [Caldisericum exile]|uniref:Ribonuclease 3 n=1 Tax=Caldisericum exile (strain DSM 21853 / NBRC 104410 / AZM16c01) TaxID=511051 RepID=A0A7U6GE33_CALEA|nr:ribonuclease III [Caldisericum exile]BAL80700.1 ribonuclease III [Caldisericum exile AZM16c01]
MAEKPLDKAFKERIDAFEKILGRKIPKKCRETFVTAITHSSFSGEHKNYRSNERLEFLGDSVLSLAITHYLLCTYKDLTEGELSRKRAYLVSEKSLSKKAEIIGIGDLMLFGKGENKSGGKFKGAILADAFEALIAAIFLCFGFEEAEKFITNIFKTELENAGKIETVDAKTKLQETIQKVMHKVPEYRIIKEEKIDDTKYFFAEVRFNGKVLGVGKGKTKKEAEENAAEVALQDEYIREIEKSVQ